MFQLQIEMETEFLYKRWWIGLHTLLCCVCVFVQRFLFIASIQIPFAYVYQI